MKKYALLYLAMLTVLAGCSKKEELLFGERPEERVAALSRQYHADLMGAPNGWFAYLFPGGGKGYTLHFDFTDSTTVDMYSDFWDEQLSEAGTSSYRIQNTGAPSLIFDTYNYLHVLADPVPSVAGGAAGQGHRSDFEFKFIRQNADTVLMEGNFQGSKLILVKASPESAGNFVNGIYTNQIDDFKDFLPADRYMYYQSAGLASDPVSVYVDTINKNVSLAWNDENGNYHSQEIAYTHTLSGLILKDAFDYNGEQLQEIRWVRENGTVAGLQVLFNGRAVRNILLSDNPVIDMVDINSLVGPDLRYTSLSVSPSDSINWSTAFWLVYTQFDANIKATVSPTEEVTGLTLFFDEENRLILRTQVTDEENNGRYEGDFEYTMVKDENNRITLNYQGPYQNSNLQYGFSNAAFYETRGAAPLLEYFANNRFYFSWGLGVPTISRVRLVTQGSAGSFVVGSLGRLRN